MQVKSKRRSSSRLPSRKREPLRFLTSFLSPVLFAQDRCCVCEGHIAGALPAARPDTALRLSSGRSRPLARPCCWADAERLPTPGLPPARLPECPTCQRGASGASRGATQLFTRRCASSSPPCEDVGDRPPRGAVSSKVAGDGRDCTVALMAIAACDWLSAMWSLLRNASLAPAQGTGDHTESFAALLFEALPAAVRSATGADQRSIASSLSTFQLV